MEKGTGKCKPCQKFYAGSMTIQSNDCTHCADLWKSNFNRDISYEWDGNKISDYNPWTKFVAWELCKNNLEEIFPKPKVPVVVVPKVPVKPDPTPNKPDPCVDPKTCNTKPTDKPSKTDSNEKQSSVQPSSTATVVQDEKSTIPLIGGVSETGSYLVYGGIILCLLFCCCIAVIACICKSTHSADRRKSVRLEKELQQMKNEKNADQLGT